VNGSPSGTKKNAMSEKQPTKIIPGQPGNEKEIERWQACHHSTQEETPRRLEEAAKVLSGIIAVTLTLVIGEAGLMPSASPASTEESLPPALLLTGTGLWLLSLLLAFVVVFPMRYRYVSRSSEDIRRMHEQTVKRKHRLLWASVALYLAALGIAAWVYLFGR
jgi:hypothetical protein